MESQDLTLVVRCILTIVNLILDGSAVKNPPAVQEMQETTSFNLWVGKLRRARQMPWTEQPGELQSTGSQSQTGLNSHTHAHSLILVYSSSVC